MLFNRFRLFVSPHRLLLIGLMLLSFTSCHNEEYIGELFGQWQITEIHTSQKKDSPRNLFLAFQSNVIFARIAGTDAHYTSIIKGTWTQTNDSLFISFYSTEELKEIDRAYVNELFAMGGDPENLRFGMKLTDKSMILTQGNDNIWKLRKY